MVPSKDIALLRHRTLPGSLASIVKAGAVLRVNTTEKWPSQLTARLEGSGRDRQDGTSSGRLRLTRCTSCMSYGGGEFFSVGDGLGRLGSFERDPSPMDTAAFHFTVMLATLYFSMGLGFVCYSPWNRSKARASAKSFPCDYLDVVGRLSASSDVN